MPGPSKTSFFHTPFGIVAKALGSMGLFVAIVYGYVAIKGSHVAPVVLRENGVPLPPEEARIVHEEIGEIMAVFYRQEGKSENLQPKTAIAKEYLELLRKAERTNLQFQKDFDFENTFLLERLVTAKGRETSHKEIERASNGMQAFQKKWLAEELDLMNWIEKVSGEPTSAELEDSERQMAKWSRLAATVLERSKALIDFCSRSRPVAHEGAITFENDSQEGIYNDLTQEIDRAWDELEAAYQERERTSQSRTADWMRSAR